ncbi:MAG: GGDEF domain-containing protein [Spirochaetales bacterium]|nr:GGDEF domain-containing protein [Spirochaetales bacterium]
MITNIDLGFPGREETEILLGSLFPGEFSLMLLDIDFFKQLNDTFGFDQGDALLELVSGVLQRTEEAVQGRAFRGYGDEFGLLVPGMSLEDAFLTADGLRREILSSIEKGDYPFRASVSIGVANHPRDGKDKDSVIRAASAALYTAKENGRNKVALPPKEDMVLKSCYYPAASLSRLKQIAASSGKKESELFREALDGLLRRYDDAPAGQECT